MASPIGLQQLAIFEEEGVEPARVVIGHADSYPNLDYYLEIVRRGAYVQFDKVGDPKAFYMREDRLINFILELIEGGFLQQILLSHDTAFPVHLKMMGGIGYDYMPTRFIPALLDSGIPQSAIDQLTVHNPRRMLTGANYN